MTTTHQVDADGADELELAPDSEFESYFDRDSGAWSLRRVPSSPPLPLAED